MLTPASPSASASSATVPGRLATTTRSSRSGPPASSASSRPRRSSPAAACQAATASLSPSRISSAACAQSRAGGVDRLGDRLAVGREDVSPDRRVGAGDAGRVAEARADLGHPLGVARQLLGGLGREHVGEHVGQVADRRHQAVVGLGVDRLRPGAEIGDHALEAVVEQTARALGGSQVPASALEQIGAGVVHAGSLGARQRVTADEALVVAEPSDQLALGRAGVGDDRFGTAGGERGLHLLRERRHRRSAEDDLSALARLRERIGDAVDRPQLERAIEVRASPPPADDLCPLQPLLRGQPDRASDQADAEDRDLHPPRRARAAAASRSSTETVWSQSMQASVIDWP